VRGVRGFETSFASFTASLGSVTSSLPCSCPFPAALAFQACPAYLLNLLDPPCLLTLAYPPNHPTLHLRLNRPMGVVAAIVPAKVV